MKDIIKPVDTDDGLFHDGDPTTETEGTIVYARIMNDLQGATIDLQTELSNVLASAGLTPDPAKQNQLLQAIQEIISGDIGNETKGFVKTVNTHKPDDSGNVKLGSAADADTVTSMTDDTSGRIPVTGWMGLGGPTVGMNNADILSKASLGNRFFRQGNGDGDNHFSGYGVGAHLLYGTSSDDTQQLSGNLFVDSSGNLSVEWLVIKISDGSVVAQRIQKLYGPLNKPTAADMAAMPYFGTALSVDLNTLGAYSAAGVHYQPENAGATTANHYPVAEAGALLVLPGAYGCQQEYTTFGTGRKFVRGLSEAWNGTDGPWDPWKEYFHTSGGSVTGTISQDSVPQATYNETALSTGDTGGKNYLRKMRGGNGDTIWHETVQGSVYRLSTGNTDAEDEFVLNGGASATFRGEVISTSANSFRIAYGGYGTFWRNDGINFYLMLTNSGDPHGNYNALRPFRVNVENGEAVMHKLNLDDFGYFDARYNAKYPAQFRVGARVTYNGSDFGSHVPQGAVNINNYTNNDDRINGVVYAYLQYNLNGNWVNFA